MTSAGPTDLARAAWSSGDQGWQLHLDGDWSLATLPAIPPCPVSAGPSVPMNVASRLSGWDTRLAPLLWQALAPLARQGSPIGLSALPDGLRSALELALPGTAGGPEDGHPVLPALTPPPGWQRWTRDALLTVAFLGEVLLALVRLARGRSDMRASDVARQIDQTGPLSLPIVSLTSFLIGLMLAYMGGAQLQRIGASNFIADVVTVGVVRELAGLMTGVILAGRIGAAFAAQLGTMQANEEIDALRALGIDPIQHLVLPRLLAMLIVAPLLVAYAALVGVLAGLPAAVGIYGVPAPEYLNKCLAALNAKHLWIGLFKGTLYIALVALAGCREGLHAGRDAHAVGAATTTAVVKGLLWIVVAASASTVMFQSLGL